MARLGPLLLGLLLLGSTSGCVVLEKRTRAHTAVKCHPSEYWDGQQCRHKGQGHGARKHDDGGKPGKGRR